VRPTSVRKPFGYRVPNLIDRSGSRRVRFGVDLSRDPARAAHAAPRSASCLSSVRAFLSVSTALERFQVDLREVGLRALEHRREQAEVRRGPSHLLRCRVRRTDDAPPTFTAPPLQPPPRPHDPRATDARPSPFKPASPASPTAPANDPVRGGGLFAAPELLGVPPHSRLEGVFTTTTNWVARSDIIATKQG